MLRRMASMLGDRRGATAVEYGLILSLVVIVILVALHNFADATIHVWNDVAGKVSNAS